jgi:hypothetical protein
MEEKGLSGSNSVWHFIRFGHRTGCSCRWRFDRRGWGGTRRSLCAVLVVSLKNTLEKSGYDLRNNADRRTHFVLVWGKVLLDLSGINTVLHVVSIIFNCSFINSVNLIFCWPCIIMYHNNLTNLVHFHFHKHFIVCNPLYVSGVKGPSSGGTTLAVFGVSCVHF